MNWKKLKKNIPNVVRTKARAKYEVFWSDDFSFDADDGLKTFGITRYNPRQIVINNKQGDKETILTYFHEFLHGLSEDYEVVLTENQVRKLEKCFPYMYEFIETLQGKKKPKTKTRMKRNRK